MGLLGWFTSFIASRRRVVRALVAVDEHGVTARRPDGETESVAWDDLRAVEILTTGAGPWSEDVFWLLHGRGGCCVVPQGAGGFDALLDRLQRLPGFDNSAVIEAMGSAEDARFSCWQARDA